MHKAVIPRGGRAWQIAPVAYAVGDGLDEDLEPSLGSNPCVQSQEHWTAGDTNDLEGDEHDGREPDDDEGADGEAEDNEDGGDEERALAGPSTER